MAICAALDEDEISRLERIMTSRKLGTDETLVEEGDPKTRVYSLTGGMLRLFKALPDGRRQISGFLLPGDYLGLADDDVHSQSAEAVVPSIVCGFAAQAMDALMTEFPPLKDRLYAMTRVALRQARESQLALGRLKPVEKLAGFLLALADRMEDRGIATHPMALPMSRADIADYLGLTIETVSRSFTKLKTLGLIRLPDAHHVDLVDRARLTALRGITI